MRLCDFLLLPDAEKAAFLYKEGVYLGKRRLAGKVVLLYQVEGFYVEVYYRQYRRHIERIGCFSDTARLDPYLPPINLEHWV